MSSVLKKKGARVFVFVALATSALVAPTPASAVIRGTSFYTIVDSLSWTQAEANAVGLGGHLVTINNVEEFKWGAENAWSTANVTAKGYSNPIILAVGFNDVLTEGAYTWSSGQQTEWGNLSDLILAQNWFDQQNSFQIWDYGYLFPNGTWEDVGQDIRYTPYTDRGTIVLMDNTASFYASFGWDLAGIAEIPITFSASQSASPIEGSGLFTTSLFFSAGTGSNLVDGETIYWGLDGITADDLSSGTMTGFGVVTNGRLDITHSLFDDGIDEIENFIVTAYSDPLLRTSEYQIGSFSAPVQSATSSTASVPGPLPILGLSSVFYWNRRLRKRIKNSKATLRIASTD